jgi:hypothetical protein
MLAAQKIWSKATYFDGRQDFYQSTEFLVRDEFVRTKILLKKMHIQFFIKRWFSQCTHRYKIKQKCL